MWFLQFEFMKIPFFVPTITSNDKKSVLKSLESRWLTNGPSLKKFELNFKNYVKTKYSSGVGNATQALHLSLLSLGIKPGDEVIVPTITYVATANAVTYCGAKPIFADIDPTTFNISSESIQKNISKKTKAVIPVHYGGQSCDMDDILIISKKNNLKIVEDCAHSLGSTYKNRKCGSIGDVGCFSFYATKVITTGEGGMVSTNNNQLDKKIKLLRSQAMSIQANEREQKSQWKYDVVDLGYNYRLDEIRSSLGLSQLRRIDTMRKMRQKLAKQYDRLLNDVKGITIPCIKKNRNHIFHLYTIKVENDFHLTRDELFTKLADNGIGTSVQYFPVNLMSIYKKNNTLPNSKFRNTNDIYPKIISLPIYPSLTIKNIEYISSILKN